MSYQINGGMWNSQAFNGPANLVTIAGDMKVLYNQRMISLDWGTVPGANYYTLQVSLYPDFRSFIINVNISESDYQFTDSSTDDVKRYWRWRPSVSSGSDWLAPWSDIGHYWLDTSAGQEIEVPEHHWTMFDMDDVTDIYWFEMVPLSATISHNINRFQGRNRLGTLLTEFLTVKDEIQISFMGDQYLEHPQLDEFERFNNTKRTFFLANYVIGKRAEPTPHIWKVEFTTDPSFAMIAAGRPDLLRGTLTLIEV